MQTFLRQITSRPRRTFVGVFLFVVIAAALGGPVFGALQTEGGFVARDAESAAATRAIEDATGTRSTAGVIVLHDTTARPATSTGRAELIALDSELRSVHGVTGVTSFATSGDRALLSRDGRTAIHAVTLAAGADDATVLAGLENRLGDRGNVLLGGSVVGNEQIGEQISADLGRAEMFAFPVLLLLSLVFFRGRRAALMPLVTGIVTVLGTFLVLRAVNEVHGLSIFALNLVVGLGLGLAIDYTLLLLTRYREELDRHGAGPEAIRATMATAGRTVAFSAATVAIALAALTLFPLNFLQSMGIGGAAVSIVAAIATLTLAPAFFALYGARLTVAHDGEDAAGRWYRIAHGVMRRPGRIAALTAILMVALSLPALRTSWTPVDATSIPTSLSSRQVADRIDAEFPRDDTSPISVAVTTDPRDGAPAVTEYANRLQALDGVVRVAQPRALDISTWQIDVTARGGRAGDVAQGVVRDIRAIPSALDARVGGEAAEFLDQQSAIGDRLPLALAFLAGLTFVVLWLMTGSVLLPVKALVMNALTVGTTLGVLTLIFQDGRLEGLLGYTSNGGIESTDFVVTAAIVFALSTDYGVFLLGRIKEVRDRALEAGETVDEREVVATGVARTGAVVTAAAILLAVAIGAFSTSSVVFIKQIGVGAAVGVLVDAFIVRALLVPSLMALLGRWNWWSPAPLRRLHARIGLREASADHGRHHAGPLPAPTRA